MPLLARMVATPLIVDVRRGALDDLPVLLADQRISTSGRVAVAVSERFLATVCSRLNGRLPHADFFSVAAGTIDAATQLADEARRASYDAIVGIGGGRVLDVTKFAAARLGLPMVAAATNLAHDGIASPVSILDNDAGRGSYGVPLPVGVVVDLAEVRRSDPRFVRAGIGDVLSNLSAIDDWELSRERTGEPVDGLAVTLARTAGEALLHRDDGIGEDRFLVVLAEALVLSGLAMAVAGTSRPCSGACHEISHALDRLFPDRAGPHGEQVGLGAAFATFLRGDETLARRLTKALRRHSLPVLPGELGFTEPEFVEAVLAAPDTRPGRFTVLEDLALERADVAEAVREYARALGT